jgi:hypothetical protein
MIWVDKIIGWALLVVVGFVLGAQVGNVAAWTASSIAPPVIGHDRPECPCDLCVGDY